MAVHYREGTRSYTIMYKVTGFMITFWIKIMLIVELIMAKYDTALMTIYIMNDYGVVCWILIALNHGLDRFRNGAHGLSRAVHDQDPYGPDRFIGI